MGPSGTIRATGFAVSLRKIRRVVDQIVKACSPRQVILFGSHATGKTNDDSDVDLLVITKRPAGSDSSLVLRRAITYAFPLDLVVYDAKTLTERIAAGDFFLQDAVAQGKVLYEAPDA